MNEEVPRYLTLEEIEAICMALTRYKNILLDYDLSYGSTYFQHMATQREQAFNKLIDKLKYGRII